MTQPASLREQLKVLEQLQELDLKIDGINKNKNALPSALKTLDDSLGRLKANANSKKKAIEDIDKTQKQARAALDLNKDRLTRSSTRLESVQNSQEYSAVNKEIEQLNKMNFNLEEQDKKSAAEVEGINKELAEIESQTQKLQGDRDAQAGVLSGQSNQLNEQLASLNKDRSVLASRVEKRLLAQYDRLRGARAGLGIVPAIAGRCKGCNMIIPSQLFNMIQKGEEMFSCPSCHRILFYPAPAPQAAVSI